MGVSDVRDKLRQLTDLYVTGEVLSLPDESLLWIQVVNAYERDECRSAGQVARARMTLALKGGGSERETLQARFLEQGRDAMLHEIAQARVERAAIDITNRVMDNPDWRERIDIALKSDLDDTAKPLEAEERELIETINRDFFAEVEARKKDELDFQVQKLTDLTDEQLLDEYIDEWLFIKCAEVARAEYELTELLIAPRWCAATVDLSTGAYRHDGCDGHKERVFADRKEVREAPDGLCDAIRGKLRKLEMTQRDPKDSASPVSSFSSSPSPSEAEESIPSSSTVTPEVVPGT